MLPVSLCLGDVEFPRRSHIGKSRRLDWPGRRASPKCFPCLLEISRIHEPHIFKTLDRLPHIVGIFPSPLGLPTWRLLPVRQQHRDFIMLVSLGPQVRESKVCRYINDGADCSQTSVNTDHSPRMTDNPRCRYKPRAVV